MRSRAVSSLTGGTSTWRSSPSPRRTWNSSSRVRGEASAWAIERTLWLATAYPQPRREQPARQPLEAAVALRLGLVDRSGPAVLTGLDGLVLPVGALDQADVSGGSRSRAGARRAPARCAAGPRRRRCRARAPRPSRAG